MKRSRLAVCAEPGCPELTDRGSYCANHRREHGRERQRNRPNFRERYGGQHPKRRQQLIAEAKRASGAVCPLCALAIDLGASGNDRRGPILDHIVPVSQGGSRERDNLRLICRSCSDSQGGRLAHEPRPPQPTSPPARPHRFRSVSL